MPSPVLSQGLTSGAWVSVSSPRLRISGCVVQASGSDGLFGFHSALLFSVQLLHFSWQLWGTANSANHSSVRWLPRRWVPFLLHGSLLGMPVPSLFLFSLFFFFFYSTQLCQEFLALFGGLSSSAIIHLMFCGGSFTYRCVFGCVFGRRYVRPLTPLPSCSASKIVYLIPI